MTYWQAWKTVTDGWNAWDRAHPTITRCGDLALVAVSIAGIVVTMRSPPGKARGWLLVSYALSIFGIGWSAISGP